MRELAEELQELGVKVEVSTGVEVPLAESFDHPAVKDYPTILRPTLYVSFLGKRFLIVALSLYEQGEIAEEWVVSAGAPDIIPRTIFRLRSGSWVFLSRDRDPKTLKWPTFSLSTKFRLGVLQLA